ncbi:hypothetical protein [Bacillus wiedmannii]|uniref:hypothetical protein n=1 Tax=Bacillus wiedmannii TaxID=1890302 RepID=UPI000BF0DC07|nr:hypothetical protein [Bacillus wiedmannii]PEM08541.1 hypothetical protein CN610_20020 [Bacillus wiedmannii]
MNISMPAAPQKSHEIKKGSIIITENGTPFLVTVDSADDVTFVNLNTSQRFSDTGIDVDLESRVIEKFERNHAKIREVIAPEKINLTLSR